MNGSGSRLMRLGTIGRGLMVTATLAGGAAAAVAVAPTAGAAAPTTFHVRLDSPGYLAGEGSFRPVGEHLTACDRKADGQTVYTDLRVGKKIYSVKDGNGAAAGCGSRDLSVARGSTADLRVCAVENNRPVMSCTGWRRVHV